MTTKEFKVTIYPHEENNTFVAIAPEPDNTPYSARWFTSNEQPSRAAAINTLYTTMRSYHPSFRLLVLGEDEVTITHVMEYNQELQEV